MSLAGMTVPLRKVCVMPPVIVQSEMSIAKLLGLFICMYS